MKQLNMTPALAALIKERVGEDVDPTNFAVFEAISLNTSPLPGKRGTLFENATVSPITLKAMVEHINAGNHLPLIADHELFGAPKGRVFHAGLDFGEKGVELRTLFYLDPTETEMITKLNAGSMDEVSVAFVSEKFLCSECGWDYFTAGSMEPIYNRTCGNGHKIGEDGAHGEMIGLRQFVELSLVARGAADNPKIVGKSQAKLAPETAQLLAAAGYEPDELVIKASINAKEDDMADAAVIAQLTSLSTSNGELTARLSVADAAVVNLTAERDSARTELASVQAELATARTELTGLQNGDVAQLAEARTVLQTQLNALRVASGEAVLEGDALPTDIAALKVAIDDKTAGLTALIPTGGRSRGAGDESNPTPTVKLDGFKVR